MAEARRFLVLPHPAAASSRAPGRTGGIAGSGRRLFRADRPVPGTPAEAYLRARGITARLDWPSLRYHPSVNYREVENAPLEQWPALLAAITANDGTITGILRTWLDRQRPAKAPLADPRRAMGHLLGNAVRFGKASAILAAGEGVETMLALKSVLPRPPLSASSSRCTPISTSISAASAPTACAGAWRINWSRPTAHAS